MRPAMARGARGAGTAGRHPAACAAAAALAALMASCGLPDPYYLVPPSVQTANPLAGQFTLAHTDRSAEAEFRGYEVYYKLYATDAAAAADGNLGGQAGTVDTLAQKGFRPLMRGPLSLPAGGLTGSAQETFAEAHVPPFLFIQTADRASSFAVTIAFGPTVDDASTNVSYTSPTRGSVLQEVDRAVTATGRCKPFTFGVGNYAPSDADFAAIASAVQGGAPIYIVLYAASYGLQNLSTPIYSYPVYMGYLELANFQL